MIALVVRSSPQQNERIRMITGARLNRTTATFVGIAALGVTSAALVHLAIRHQVISTAGV